MEFIKKYWVEIVVCLIIVFGAVVRVLYLGDFPNALNADEANSGYEAYSIMKYGVDRNGNSFPVVLKAWGSGQNALYSYILIPFIAVLGLNVFSLRLPMAIFGVVSLFSFYVLCRTISKDKRFAVLGTLFLAICPWHIMKSRWGLESNIFPDLILYGVTILALGVKNKKRAFEILAFVIFGISSYAYGTSYLFLPVFVIGVLIYLYKKKVISLKRAIGYLTIVFVISFPVILYVLINTFDLNTIHLGPFTVPKMVSNRAEEVSTVFSGNIFENCVNNLMDSLKIILVQNDGLEWNAIPDFGMFYLISVLFLVYGIYLWFKKKDKTEIDMIMGFWSLGGIALCMFCIPNINRINVVCFPLIYYIVMGIWGFVSLDKWKFVIPGAAAFYLASFVLFIQDYSHKDYNEYLTFTSGVKEVSEFCEDSEKEVYCLYSFKEPFIYFLFYQEYNTREYLDTVEYFYEDGVFDNVKAFGKYRFYIPEVIPDDSIVIVPSGVQIKTSNNVKNVQSINQFDVYEF